MADGIHSVIVEDWKPVPGWEGIYEICLNTRQVRSLEREVNAGRGGTQWRPSKVLKQRIVKRYLDVTLRDGPRCKHKRIHSMICEITKGPRPSPDHVVRHLNGDRFDNSPSNLAWGTAAENAADMIAHGNSLKGSRNHACNLSESSVIEIRRRITEGERQVNIAKDFGVWQGTISAIATGRAWGWLKG